MAKAPGRRKYDCFYAARDNNPNFPGWGRPFANYASYTLTSPAGPADGAPFVCTVASGFLIAAGQTVNLNDGVTSQMYRCIEVISSTQFRVLDLFSSGGTGGAFGSWNKTWGTGTAVTVNQSNPHVINQMLIDLRDAPPAQNYDYIIFGSASVRCSYPNGVVPVQIRIARFEDQLDTYFPAPNHVRGRALIAPKENWRDSVPWNVTFPVRFSAGDAYYVNLEAMAQSTFAVGLGYWVLENMRMCALRVNAAHPYYRTVGTAGNAMDPCTATTTTWVSNTNQITIPADLPADYYLVATSAIVSQDGAGKRAGARLLVGTLGDYPVYPTPPQANTDMTVSWVELVYMPTSQRGQKIYWQTNAWDGGTSTLKSVSITLMPVGSIYGASTVFQGSQVLVSGGTGSNEWSPIASSTMNPTAGNYLEFMSAQYGHAGGLGGFYVRPEWGGDEQLGALPNAPTNSPNQVLGIGGYDCPRGKAGYSTPNDNWPHTLEFYFWKGKHGGQPITNRLSAIMRPNAAGVQATKVYADYIRSCAIRLKLYEPDELDMRSVFVRIEIGGAYKRWDVAGTLAAGVQGFVHDFPAMIDISRVWNNDKLMYAMRPGDAWVADAWVWDPTTKRLTIGLGGGQTPADANRTVFVAEAKIFSRDAETITCETLGGIEIPAAPRLMEVPSIEHTLDIRSDGIELGASFGSLVLNNADNYFRDYVGQRTFKGLQATYYKGIHKRDAPRSEAEELGAGVMDTPEMTPEQMELRVSPIAMALARPVNTTLVDVWQGNTLTTKFTMPTVWGFAWGVPAYRLTNNRSATTDQNIWKYSSRSVATCSAVYQDAQKTDVLLTVTTNDTANGQVWITNSNIPGWTVGAQLPDVLYVDVYGYQSASTFYGLGNSPSSIIASLLVDCAGLTQEQFCIHDLRVLGRYLIRSRFSITRGYTRTSIGLGLYVEGAETVGEAVNRVCGDAFMYWGESRIGRLRFGVPDREAQFATDNTSCERYQPLVDCLWPWQAHGSASAAIQSTTVLDGIRAIEVSSGGWGTLAQYGLISRAGHWAMACGAAFKVGAPGAFRLFMIRPGDGYRATYSDPFQLTNIQWERPCFNTFVEPGELGTAMFGVAPFTPIGYEPTPPTAPQPYAWYVADDLINGMGSIPVGTNNVSVWSSRGPSAPMQSVSVPTQPVVRRDMIAGHAAVVFNRSNSALTTQGGSPTFNVTMPYTILMVWMDIVGRVDETGMIAAVAGRRLLSSQTANWLMGGWGGEYQAYTGSAFLPSGGAVTLGRPILQCLMHTSASLSEHFLNGTSLGTSVTAGQIGPGTLVMGCTGAYPAEAACAAVAEIVMFTSTLTADQRQSWETYLMTKYGLVNTQVAVDQIAAAPVAAVIKPTTYAAQPSKTDLPLALDSQISRVSVRGQYAYEVRVPFVKNLQKEEQAAAVVVTDNEARNILTIYDPASSQAKATLQTAGRLDFSRPIAQQIDSAQGIARPLVLYFSRLRTVLELTHADKSVDIPQVGELLYHPPLRHVPDSPTGDPFWLITRVVSSDADTVEIECERPLDPITDRTTIAKAEFPIGYMGIAAVDTPAAGWSEVSDLRGKYLMGAPTADIVGNYGADFHTHTFNHTHPASSHYHTYNVNAVGFMYDDSSTLGPDAAGHPIDTWMNMSGYDVGAYGVANHKHDTGGAGPFNSLQVAAFTSSNVTSTTKYGPNRTADKRVTVRRRVGGGGSTNEIPKIVCIGWLSAAMPAGWERATELDGWTLRVADPLRAGQTWTNPTASTIDDAVVLTVPATVPLNVGTSIWMGSPYWWGVVSGIATGSPNNTVICATMGYVAHTATTIPAGAILTVDPENAGTSFGDATHAHRGTGMIPSHTHTAPHSHFDPYPPGYATSRFEVPGSVTDRITGGVINETFPRPVGETRPVKWDGMSTAASGTFYGGASHTHKFRPNLTTHSGATGAAAGDVTSETVNTIATMSMVWIRPRADTVVTEVPAGGIIFGDGPIPNGYERLVTADGFFLKGAAAGTGGGDQVAASHAHTGNFASHSYPHTHSVASTITLGDEEWGNFVVVADAGYGVAAAAGARAPYPYYDNPIYARGHRHSVSLTGQSNPLPTGLLAATTGLVSSVESPLPRHAKILVLRRT